MFGSAKSSTFRSPSSMGNVSYVRIAGASSRRLQDDLLGLFVLGPAFAIVKDLGTTGPPSLDTSGAEVAAAFGVDAAAVFSLAPWPVVTWLPPMRSFPREGSEDESPRRKNRIRGYLAA